MKRAWVDRTSYSQSEARGTRVPRSWALGTWPYEVKVSRLFDVPGAWFLTFDLLGISTHQLGSAELEAAQAEAIEVVRAALVDFNAAMAETLGPPPEAA